MADTAKTVTLKFLDASARSLATTAPPTSAHLMLERSVAADGDDKVPGDGKADSICKACGAFLLPGWTSRKNIFHERPFKPSSLRPRSRKRAKYDKTRARESYLKIDCLHCGRFEKTPLQYRRSSRRFGTQQESQVAGSTGTTEIESAARQSQKATTTNTGSKQRAKARKQGGLQALLEKSRTTTNPSSGFGLDLLDMMKQG